MLSSLGLKGQMEGEITRTWRGSTNYVLKKPTDCNLAEKEQKNKYLKVSCLFLQLAETNQNQRAGKPLMLFNEPFGSIHHFLFCSCIMSAHLYYFLDLKACELLALALVSAPPLLLNSSSKCTCSGLHFQWTQFSLENLINLCYYENDYWRLSVSFSLGNTFEFQKGLYGDHATMPSSQTSLFFFCFTKCTKYMVFYM